MLWSFPASSLPLFTSPPLHSATLPTSIFQGWGVGGCPAVSHPRLDGVFCRFWAEHGFRLGGAGWADFLLLWHARWPGPGCCRRRACCHGFHGGDPGGAAVRWPLEAVPWHWDWDDHHQSGQVRTRSFEWPHLKNRGQSRSCSISSFHLSVVGSTGEASHVHSCFCIWTSWRNDLVFSVTLPFFSKGHWNLNHLYPHKHFCLHMCYS